jgi:hypothetical protein
MANEQKFPSEVIDLPSKGRLYPENSPLRDGKIEIKYMTAREEDILTSQNLIKKGVVIDKLLNSLILTKGVNTDDMLLGDKNAIMVAARILAYGPEYTCELINPLTDEKFEHTFNLADCPFKELDESITENLFEVQLPASKIKIKYRLLTGKEEGLIEKDLKASKKIGNGVSPELTTRFRYLIKEVDGDNSQSVINNFSQNILARDSMFLREEMGKHAPDIDLTQEIDIEGETVSVDIPMTVNFFWPKTRK